MPKEVSYLLNMHAICMRDPADSDVMVVAFSRKDIFSIREALNKGSQDIIMLEQTLGYLLESIHSDYRSVDLVNADPAVVELARRHGVEMPICEAVNEILAGRASVDDAIETLLARPFTLETA